MLSATARWRTARRPDRAALTAGLLVLAGIAVIAGEARGSTFSGDDWSFILQRRGFSADVLLRPHNEHLSALPILAYKLLLAVFGAGSYAPFMAVLLALHATGCLLLYTIARRHVGAWAALVPAAILVTLGPAWQDLLWAFQIGYLGSVAAGLGMILCLEQRGRRADVWAAGLLGLALLCSSVGLALIPLAVVLIMFNPPRDGRRLWTVVAPVVLYGIWWAFYGVATARADNLAGAPGYVFNALAAGVASVTGLGQTHRSPYLVATTWGGVVAVGLLASLIVRLVRGGRPATLTWAALLSAGVLWSAEAIEYFPSGREAAQSRYQYAAAVLILLAIVPAVGARQPSAATGRRPSRLGLAVLATVTPAVCASNLAILHSRVGFWTQNAYFARTEEGALAIERGVAQASFEPENAFTIALVGNHNLGAITAGPYFSAATAFGTDAYSPTQIQGRPEDEREAADIVLVFGERLHLVSTPRTVASGQRGGSAPRSGSGTGTDSGTGCRPASAGVVTRTAPGTVTVSNPAQRGARLQVRRFGARYRLPLAIAPHSTVRLSFPADHSLVPWHVEVLGPPGVELCA